MISDSNISFIKDKINKLDAAINSGDKSAEIDKISEATNLFGDILPKIKDCYTESTQYSGTVKRNANNISNLLKQYLISELEVPDEFESTFRALGTYPSVQKSYKDGIEKYEKGIYGRNTLDDMRLALETLIKLVLNNDKSLENNLNEIGRALKDKDVSKEFRDMFTALISYYTHYNDNNVKHNDNVNQNEIEYVIEFTSITLKTIIKLFKTND